MGHRTQSVILTGTMLAAGGLVLFFLPEEVFGLVLDLVLGYLAVNSVYLLYKWIRTKKGGDLLHAALSVFFFVFITRHQAVPEWMVRVAFGLYLMANGTATLIQFWIDVENEIRGKRALSLFYSILYLVLGAVLLFSNLVTTKLLIQFFGLYFLVLSTRYFVDAWHSRKDMDVHWKRKVRIMLPQVVTAFIPDAWIARINKSLEDGEFPLVEEKSERKPRLRVMVHVGPEGFQKIGHISFAWDGLVFSYGNYDSDSFHLNGTLGDGVYFNTDITDYIPNMMQAENNSIFEFGILTTPEQDERIERHLQQLYDRSLRWYCRIEREDGYRDPGPFLKDYPSRLHLKTGSKFYKFKRGKFKTYWALGDNCCLFIDAVLGQLGAAVLNVRGIVSPGAYLDWLDAEYARASSPVVSRNIHLHA